MKKEREREKGSKEREREMKLVRGGRDKKEKIEK